jgi:hypothetical protein
MYLRDPRGTSPQTLSALFPLFFFLSFRSIVGSVGGPVFWAVTWECGYHNMNTGSLWFAVCLPAICPLIFLLVMHMMHRTSIAARFPIPSWRTVCTCSCIKFRHPAAFTPKRADGGRLLSEENARVCPSRNSPSRNSNVRRYIFGIPTTITVCGNILSIYLYLQAVDGTMRDSPPAIKF